MIRTDDFYRSSLRDDQIPDKDMVDTKQGSHTRSIGPRASGLVV